MNTTTRIAAWASAGVLVLALGVVGCVGPTTAPSAGGTAAGGGAVAVGAKDVEVEALAKGLQGVFNSKKQSETDPEYFNVQLHMVRIWADRGDGIWLYVEQAMADRADQPYRQRVYQVHRRADGKLVSEVYLLPGTPEEVLKFAGAWKSEKPLTELSPDKLVAKEGCEMVMTAVGEGVFKGGTVGKNCPSELRGASYAVSEAEITPGQLRTWDRGYNKEDKQVWGAKKGPYLFDRQQ